MLSSTVLGGNFLPGLFMGGVLGSAICLFYSTYRRARRHRLVAESAERALRNLKESSSLGLRPTLQFLEESRSSVQGRRPDFLKGDARRADQEFLFEQSYFEH